MCNVLQDASFTIMYRTKSDTFWRPLDYQTWHMNAESQNVLHIIKIYCKGT